MADEPWRAVDEYLGSVLLPPDAILDAALADAAAAGLPPADVSPLQGAFLHLLARAVGARRVLELGTLAGYSTIWLARALPADGRLVTLEIDAAHAAVARTNLERARVAERVDVRVGPAAESLERLAGERAEPFDLVFLDADKARNPDYLAWALKLGRPGTLIIADNVVRSGAVAERTSADPSVRGVRRFLELLADEPRVVATAIQTVGSKGHDGLALALVLDAERPARG